MKKNFTVNEKNILENVVKSISPAYSVEFNKAGNLTVRRAGLQNIWYTLYRSDINNGLLVWRRLWNDGWSKGSHLLNCRGRKNQTCKYGTWRIWDGVNAHAGMETFEEAMNYAAKYFNK